MARGQARVSLAGVGSSRSQNGRCSLLADLSWLRAGAVIAGRSIGRRGVAACRSAAATGQRPALGGGCTKQAVSFLFGVLIMPRGSQELASVYSNLASADRKNVPAGASLLPGRETSSADLKSLPSIRCSGDDPVLGSGVAAAELCLKAALSVLTPAAESKGDGKAASARGGSVSSSSQQSASPRCSLRRLMVDSQRDVSECRILCRLARLCYFTKRYKVWAGSTLGSPGLLVGLRCFDCRTDWNTRSAPLPRRCVCALSASRTAVEC